MAEVPVSPARERSMAGLLSTVMMDAVLESRAVRDEVKLMRPTCARSRVRWRSSNGQKNV